MKFWRFEDVMYGHNKSNVIVKGKLMVLFKLMDHLEKSPDETNWCHNNFTISWPINITFLSISDGGGLWPLVILTLFAGIEKQFNNGWDGWRVMVGSQRISVYSSLGDAKQIPKFSWRCLLTLIMLCKHLARGNSNSSIDQQQPPYPPLHFDLPHWSPKPATIMHTSLTPTTLKSLLKLTKSKPSSLKPMCHLMKMISINPSRSR